MLKRNWSFFGNTNTHACAHAGTHARVYKKYSNAPTNELNQGEAPAPKAKGSRDHAKAPPKKPLDLTSNEDFPTFAGKRNGGPAPVDGNKPAATWVRPAKK